MIDEATARARIADVRAHARQLLDLAEAGRVPSEYAAGAGFAMKDELAWLEVQLSDDGDDQEERDDA